MSSAVTIVSIMINMRAYLSVLARSITGRAFRVSFAAGVMLLAVSALSPQATAQLGSRPTEQWLKTLESANRLAKLKVDEALAALQLKPGAVVADIGAGSGVFTLPLAKAVTTAGKVYAVDIEQGLVEH